MSDPVALVTGAASGIGSAVAKSLSAAGMRVAVCDVQEAAGQAVAEQVGGKFFYCDVSRLDSVAEAVAGCERDLGAPLYAHLNAGIMTVPTNAPYLAVEQISEEQYRRLFGVNLDGVFHGLKALIPGIRERQGAITLTASTAGLTLVPVDPLYTASKYAVIGLGRAVAAANEGSGLRVNVICPGVVDTAIVPDDFRDPKFGIMPAEALAAEVLDLLKNGRNGEVRVKARSDIAAFSAEPLDLSQAPPLS